MNEREKQLAGIAYDGADRTLKEMQYRAQNLVKRLNDTPMEDEETRALLLKRLLGKVGANLRIFSPLRVDFGCNIETGDNVLINQNCTILDTNRVIIGDRVLIAPDVKIYAADHPTEGAQRCIDVGGGKARIVTVAKPVTIGSDVWIGGGAIILPGVTVGDNVVVGAGSVVCRDVPSNVIVAGNPAKIIKYLKGALNL